MNSAPKVPSSSAQPSPTTASSDFAARLASSLTRQPATIATLDGRYVTGGVAEFSGSPLQWTATLAMLDQPGHVATLFFAEGVRDVVVRLEDGRTARARLTGTSVLAGARRVCHLTGAERLG